MIILAKYLYEDYYPLRYRSIAIPTPQTTGVIMASLVHCMYCGQSSLNQFAHDECVSKHALQMVALYQIAQSMDEGKERAAVIALIDGEIAPADPVLTKEEILGILAAGGDLRKEFHERLTWKLLNEMRRSC